VRAIPNRTGPIRTGRLRRSPDSGVAQEPRLLSTAGDEHHLRDERKTCRYFDSDATEDGMNAAGAMGSVSILSKVNPDKLILLHCH
jgi:hypothetical protein